MRWFVWHWRSNLFRSGRGASGVRWSVIELIEAFIAHDIVPGSRAGVRRRLWNLAPLAHITAALMGEGNVFVQRGGDASRRCAR